MKSIEHIVSHRERVFLKDGQWVASLDGSHSVPVDRKLGAIIRMSLSLTKNVSALQGTIPYTELRKNPEYRRHDSYNCHRLALEIQGEALDLYDAAHSYKSKLYEKFESNALTVCDSSNIYEKLQSAQFPLFLHAQNDREGIADHSTLILGPDERGTYICFEKAGYYNQPFRLVKLEDVLRPYTHMTHTLYLEPDVRHPMPERVR